MKIAVIGSGVSGLVAAHLLSNSRYHPNPHQVELFEQADTLGGHTATVDVEHQGQRYAIDTGFIVFNDKTYPNFRQLMRDLGVLWRDTEMSFSVKDPVTNLEYNGHSLGTLFAQKRNYLRPKFYKLLFEIVRFNKAAKQALDEGQDLDRVTLDQFLQQHNFDSELQRLYLLPMVAAIWSASLAEAAAFPLGFFLRFFNNHGLLNIADRPQWHTIIGGSRSYIKPLIEPFKEQIRLGCAVSKVVRENGGVTIQCEDGSLHYFDEVIFACHSDQALQLLGDATAQERSILGAIPYQNNEVVLHTDIQVLPKRKRAWASWNYLLHDGEHAQQRPSSVTYDMNILQGIDAPETFCVTLNNTSAIDPNKILRQFTYAHPVYSVESLAARERRHEICGLNHTHFVGAYWYNGFHEDGVRSAIDVANRLGATWQWQ